MLLDPQNIPRHSKVLQEQTGSDLEDSDDEMSVEEPAGDDVWSDVSSESEEAQPQGPQLPKTAIGKV